MGGLNPHPETRSAEPDELPELPDGATAKPLAPLAKDPTTGRFLPRNKAAKGPKQNLLRPQLMGLDYAAGNPVLDHFLKWAKRYSKARRAELAAMCGGSLSAGASSLVETASLALANSRYLQYIGGKGKGEPDLLLKSSRLADQARQTELAAYELAVREYKGRPKVDVQHNPFAVVDQPEPLPLTGARTGRIINADNTDTVPPEPGATYVVGGQLVTVPRGE